MTTLTQQVDAIITQQRNYYDQSSTKDVHFRKEQLVKLKQTIKKYEKQVLEALKLDLGKGEFEAYTTELGIVYDSISFIIKNIERWVKPKSVKTPLHFQPAKSFIVREPYGVVLIIAPFNYPFQLVMEPLIGAIAGGNTAVIKPSEASVHTTQIIKLILEEAFEPNYVSVVEGEKEMVTALIHAPFDFIFFTGSVAVGKVVAKAAAERLTPYVLELGGKSPTIVSETADLEVAAKRIAWGKFSNTGQTCVAPDYVVVHESIYPTFVELLKKTIKDFYGHDPQQSTDYGRIINERQFDRLHHILIAEESNITLGGSIDRQDLYIEPTIIEHVTWNSVVMEDEIFGPLLPVLKYSSLDHLIREIRRLPKPLAGYLFSTNEKEIQKFLQELPFGGGCINDVVAHVGNTHLPFGGVGPSGSGAYHGKASYECFTHPKSILHRSTKLETGLLHPPYNSRVKLVRKILK